MHSFKHFKKIWSLPTIPRRTPNKILKHNNQLLNFQIILNQHILTLILYSNIEKPHPMWMGISNHTHAEIWEIPTISECYQFSLNNIPTPAIYCTPFLEGLEEGTKYNGIDIPAPSPPIWILKLDEYWLEFENNLKTRILIWNIVEFIQRIV